MAADDPDKPRREPPRVVPVVPPTVQPVRPAPVVQPVKGPPVVQPVKGAPVVQPVKPAAVVQPVKVAPVVQPVKPAAAEEAPAAALIERQVRAGDRVVAYSGIPVAVQTALVIVVLTGLAAAVAWQTSRRAADGAFDAVDSLGVLTARLLAVPEFESWDREAGTSAGLRRTVLERIEEQEATLKQIENEDERKSRATVLADAKDRLIAGVLVDREPADAVRRKRNEERLRSVVGDALLGAEVFTPTRAARGVGTLMPTDVQSLGKAGETEIASYRHGAGADAIRARLYLHPIRGLEVGSDGNYRVVGFAGVALSAEAAHAAVAEAERQALHVLLLVAGAGVLAALACLAPLLPLRRVLRDAEEFSRGNFEHRTAGGGSGEVGAIGRAVARIALTARDREIAAQARAAPAVVPPADHRTVVEPALKPGPVLRVPAWEVEGTSRPCFEIAGDFFDYVPVGDTGFAAILVETSMRGLPAAFAAAEVRGLFRGAAPGATGPAALLAYLGSEVGPRLPGDGTVTATCVLVDTAAGTARIARAGGGNAPVGWHAATRALEEISVEGTPIRKEGGVGTGGPDLVEVVAELAPRDRLSLFSDGLRRARNRRKETFGEERLGALVLKFGPMNSTAFVNMVLNEVDLFHEGATQGDDLTVLTLRRLK